MFKKNEESKANIPKLFPPLTSSRQETYENNMEILTALATRKGCTLYYFGKKMSKGSAYKLLQTLVGLGWIKQVDTPGKRGKKPYQLTGLGLLAALSSEKLHRPEKLEKVFEKHKKYNDALIELLYCFHRMTSTNSEKDFLVRWLEKLSMQPEPLLMERTTGEAVFFKLLSVLIGLWAFGTGRVRGFSAFIMDALKHCAVEALKECGKQREQLMEEESIIEFFAVYNLPILLMRTSLIQELESMALVQDVLSEYSNGELEDALSLMRDMDDIMESLRYKESKGRRMRYHKR